MQDIEIIKKIDAYVKGKLTAQEVEDLWVEILQKPEYLSYLDINVNLNELIRSESASSRENLHQKNKNHYVRWLSIAASILIILGVISFITLKTNTVQIDSVPYINKTEFESSNVLRSADEHISEENQLLNKGYNESITGHFENALNTYRQLVKKYNTGLAVPKAYLNIGIIHYNNDNFSRALKAFDNAIKANENNSIIKEKAFWYKGNTLIQLKKFDQAQKAIQKAYNMNGIYHKPASKLLHQLKENNFSSIE